MSREVANFRTFWKSTTFSSVLEPIDLPARLRPRPRRDARRPTSTASTYVQFVGTGMVATAVIFSSALPAMFGTFVKHRFQNTYDAILAAPVDVEELVTAEMLWIGIRAGLLRLLPAAGRRCSSASTRPGGCCSCRSSASSPRSASPASASRSRRRVAEDRPVQLRDDAVRHAAVPGRRHVLPDRPAAARAPRWLAQFNPLHQLVELVRDACFGFEAARPAALRGPDRVRPRDVAAGGQPAWTKRLID